MYVDHYHQPKVLVSCKDGKHSKSIKHMIESFGYAAFCVRDIDKGAAIITDNSDIKLVVTDYDLGSPMIHELMALHEQEEGELSFIVVDEDADTVIGEGPCIHIPFCESHLEEYARQFLCPMPNSSKVLTTKPLPKAS